ncbi:MAG: hypothetical protein PHY71_07925 [Bacteroidaceae bacterium]|nr:hypothetical protein [Bacteroidaceae bacterium]
MRKKLKRILSSMLIAIICGFFWYYYPRTVPFKFVMEIKKPYKEFDCSSFIGFHYANSKDRLMFFLVEYGKKYSPHNRVYDSLFVENIAEKLDFKRCDYIIGYQKRLKALRHSPHLRQTEDGLYFDKRTPLIPTWDSTITNKIYIYQIKKNNKYRTFGP